MEAGLVDLGTPRIDLLSLTGAEVEATAAERLSRGAGVARKIYKDAVLRGRFEPEEHGLGAEASSAWRARFELRFPVSIFYLSLV